MTTFTPDERALIAQLAESEADGHACADRIRETFPKNLVKQLAAARLFDQHREQHRTGMRVGEVVPVPRESRP